MCLGNLTLLHSTVWESFVKIVVPYYSAKGVAYTHQKRLKQIFIKITSLYLFYFSIDS